MAELARHPHPTDSHGLYLVPPHGAARTTGERTALLLGRAIFGGYFLYSGINHFLQKDTLVGYSRSKGVPFPDVAVPGTGAMLILGGLSLMTGVRPKVGASLIAGFLAGVTPVMHAFWTIEEGPQRMHEMVNFTKNVALAGGAALAAASPEPWPARVRLPGLS